MIMDHKQYIYNSNTMFFHKRTPLGNVSLSGDEKFKKFCECGPLSLLFVEEFEHVYIVLTRLQVTYYYVYD